MYFGSSVGKKDAEHTGVGFVEISKTFAVKDAIFCGSESFYVV